MPTSPYWSLPALHGQATDYRVGEQFGAFPWKPELLSPKESRLPHLGKLR
jgi:hypothetical protein